MLRKLLHILALGLKELNSIRADPILLALTVYTFSYAVYAVATGAKTEVDHVSTAIVDEDHSELSRLIRQAILPPWFQPPVEIPATEIGPSMDASRYVFVIEIPPKFEQDVISNRYPSLQINMDATAVAQAGNGGAYLQQIINQLVQTYATRAGGTATTPSGTEIQPVNFALRVMFNPNLKSEWFTSVMQVINNITMLSIILTGAALIREREHGTIEHLLAMPVTPSEIMLSKIWANGLVILVAAILSMKLVVQLWLQVPIAGSLVLFLAGAVVYAFSVTSMGILLATYHDLDGAVRPPGDPGPRHPANALRLRHADGDHAGLAAGRHANLSHAAFRQLLPGRSLSGGRPRYRLARTPRHGDHQRRLLRRLRRALPQDPCRPGIGRSRCEDAFRLISRS